MTPDDLNTRFPPRPGYRRFRMTVENGCGDEGSTVVYVPDHRSPRQHGAAAIARVRTVLPDEGPWKLREVTEL